MLRHSWRAFTDHVAGVVLFDLLDCLTDLLSAGEGDLNCISTLVAIATIFYYFYVDDCNRECR